MVLKMNTPYAHRFVTLILSNHSSLFVRVNARLILPIQVCVRVNFYPLK